MTAILVFGSRIRTQAGNTTEVTMDFRWRGGMLMMRRVTFRASTCMSAAPSSSRYERSVENIAADKSECSLKVERGKDLARQHRTPEIRCMIIDRLDHEICDGFTVVIP